MATATSSTMTPRSASQSDVGKVGSLLWRRQKLWTYNLHRDSVGEFLQMNWGVNEGLAD